MSVPSVGIFLFDEVEVLDFAGPFEVFSVAAAENGDKLFQVKTISADGGMIRARNGLKVTADLDFAAATGFDVLLIPGGYGARVLEIKKKPTLEWLKRAAETSTLVASVCTGTFLLAETGLVTTESVTTHWQHIVTLRQNYPGLTVEENARYVDSGRIVTSAGISAGIDMSLYLVSRLIDMAAAKRTARQMEYDWHPV